MAVEMGPKELQFLSKYHPFCFFMIRFETMSSAFPDTTWDEKK